RKIGQGLRKLTTRPALDQAQTGRPKGSCALINGRQPGSVSYGDGFGIAGGAAPLDGDRATAALDIPQGFEPRRHQPGKGEDADLLGHGWQGGSRESVIGQAP